MVLQIKFNFLEYIHMLNLQLNYELIDIELLFHDQ